MRNVAIRLSIFLVSVFACSGSRAADGWQAYMTVTGNYFEGLSGGTRIVLILSSTFHTCGWNQAANINLSTVGDDSFKNLTAVVLTALAAGRSLSVYMSGCDHDRAQVVALRLG